MNKRTLAVARAVTVVGATAALIVGVTFANFTANATLSGNTLSTATAGLELNNGSGFSQSVQGFTMSDLVPGADSAPFNFQMQDTSGVPLNITAHVPTAPTFSGFETGGFSGVHIKFEKQSDSSIVADTTLGDLLAGDVAMGAPLNPIAGNATENLKIIVNIDPSAVTGSNAHIDAFDIVFTGTQ